MSRPDLDIALRAGVPAGNRALRMLLGPAVSGAAIEPRARGAGAFPATVQRVRVRLSLAAQDEDLMKELRRVRVGDEGDQMIEGTDGIARLRRIGASEDIIFEGHGHYNTPWFGTAKVVSHAGIPPADIARHAATVPKPQDWSGRIILLGCKTGDVTEEVSKAYFRLTERAVLVIGTPTNIKVGADAARRQFLGSEWTDLPERDRPRDLQERFQLELTFERFLDAERTFGVVAAEVERFKNRSVKKYVDEADELDKHALVVQDSHAVKGLGRLGEVARELADASPGRYEHPLRQRFAIDFRDLLVDVTGLPGFERDRSSMRVSWSVGRGDHEALSRQDIVVQDFADSVSALMHKWASHVNTNKADRFHLGQFINGLMIRELDVLSPREGVHREMVRTKQSFFGDTWEDRAKRRSTVVL